MIRVFESQILSRVTLGFRCLNCRGDRSAPAALSATTTPMAGRRHIQPPIAASMLGNCPCSLSMGRLLLLASVGILFMPAACVTVDPQPDFRQASERIADRLGVTDVYDPAADAQIDEKVDSLIGDGLTCNEAVTVALLNNRGFQALFQTIGASRADVVQSGLMTNPSIVIGGRFPEAGGRSELTLGIAQQLVDLWQIPVRKRGAEADLRRTVLAVLNEAVNIAGATRSRYYDLLWRRRAEQIAEENMELTRRLLAVAEARFNAGDVSPLDVGLVRTQVFAAQDALWSDQRERELARLALAQVLGLAARASLWDITDELRVEATQIPPDGDILSFAIGQRFDVRMSDARVAAAEQRLELERLNVFPGLEIGLNAERTERRAMPGRKILADTARSSVGAGQLSAPTIESKGQRDLARRQFIDSMIGPSIQLTLPIWHQNQAQIAKAEFELARAMKERENRIEGIATEVRRASIDARIALQRHQFFTSEVLPQVDANLNSARSQYENGAESVVVLIEAQEAAFVQKRVALNTLRDYLQARAELDRVTGGRLPVQAVDQPPDESHVNSQTEVERNAK